MPQNFLDCDRDQPMLLPPDLREWLPEDHLAWFVIEAVGELDLEPFYSSYRSDGHGRAAHEPEMMVALFTYAYAIGERSSRKIETRCTEDIAFRVICANRVPDHVTIARFRARHQNALGELFGQILGLCTQAGIVDAKVLAVDGSKFEASAPNHATRDYRAIAEEIIEHAGAIDEAEDEIHGEARGDELPEGLRTSQGRRSWIREAKKRLEGERVADPEPVPKERADRLSQCERRLREDWRTENRANADYEAYRSRDSDRRGHGLGHPPKPYEPSPEPEGKINVTDPDSKNMKAYRGYTQGYNAQAVTTEGQIIVAAEIAADGIDSDLLGPMISQAEAELEGAGAASPEVVLADSGYWKNEHIDALRSRGITPLVAADADKRKGPRKTRLGGPYDFMRRVLASERGGELYSQRQWMVEPIFAEIKQQRRSGRFKRRGRAAVRSEWRLIAATHNLLKLHRHRLRVAAG
ncbi:MAG: transposase [Solirubrobacterales bacterium]